MINYKNKPFYLNDAQVEWVETTLANLSVEKKIAQLFMPLGISTSSNELKKLLELGVGGVMYRALPKKIAIKTYSYLQNNSKIPLLIGANLETGSIGAFNEGTHFANPLQVAATNTPEMAYKLGKISCYEASNIGINYAFAPIVDIDMNFRNPITNVRTFGSNVETIISCASEYLKAADEENVATAIKHFPGDGVDERDQHLLTSINSLSMEEWNQSYGKIYRCLIEKGTKSIMVGHIALPAYTKNQMPASLSKEIMTDLLRNELGFNGLIITDATPMVGFRCAMPRKDAVPLSIAAGADIFLFNRTLETDYQYMLDGYKNGVLTEKRLNEAVGRILALKASLKLNERNFAFGNKKTINYVESVNECADLSVTLVKDKQKILPISSNKYPRVYLNVLQDNSDTMLAKTFKKRLEKEGFKVTIRDRESIIYLKKLTTKASIIKKIYYLLRGKKSLGEMQGNPKDFIQKYDLVIYVANIETLSNNTQVRINWKSFMGMGNDLPWFVKEIPTIFISLANPYHLLDVPMIETFINAYTNNQFVIENVISKMCGNTIFKGVSPVDVSCGIKDII